MIRLPDKKELELFEAVTPWLIWSEEGDGGFILKDDTPVEVVQKYKELKSLNIEYHD